MEPEPSSEEPATVICPACSTHLDAGSNFCDMCGVSLQEATPSPPEPRPEPEPASVPTQLVTIQGRLVVEATGAAIPLYGKTKVIIGRGDPSSGTFPQIDMTEHGGKEGGVSRRHARLAVQGGQVLIEDLNSTNGTRVNGKKLRPNQPHPVEYGDEITLGWVKMTFEE
jgi:hypothetical protein